MKGKDKGHCCTQLPIRLLSAVHVHNLVPACRIGSATGQEFQERPPDAMRPDDMDVEGPSEDGDERAQPSAGPQKVCFCICTIASFKYCLESPQKKMLIAVFLAFAGLTKGKY